jgi:CheY-like chemotaxis protein
MKVRMTPLDTGQGIAPEFLPQLFDLFSQASLKTTRHSGIGLGLALVKALVEGHGGSVRAESPGTGKGATFTVRLPALPADALAPVIGLGVTDTTADVPIRLDGVTVLIAEDDLDAREVFRLILEAAGAKVEAVGSVAGALRALDDVRPDVLISDIGMPDQDGFALIRHIRAREVDGGHLPAIALTGYVTPEYATRLREAGFDVYMPKPAEPDDLLARVASLARPGRP